MPKFSKVFLFFCLLTVYTSSTSAQAISPHSKNHENSGQYFSIDQKNNHQIDIRFQIKDYQIHKQRINNESFDIISLPGSFLPNKKGAPALPCISCFLAVPQNAEIEMTVSEGKTDKISDLNIAPSFPLVLQNEKEPKNQKEDESIYSKNCLYPQKQVMISQNMKIRGIDVVKISVSPFQYNPQSHELQLRSEILIQLKFPCSNGQFGDPRLRNPWWDAMAQQLVLNPDVLDQTNYAVRSGEGCEYLIICPDDEKFIQWADSIKVFRTYQGIKTDIATLAEIGGNNADAIESFIDNAWQNWSIPPAAVLLLGDHGTDELSIVSPTVPHPYAGTCISDNKYADVDGDALPDITMARITARDESELSEMISKFINYEKNPPTEAGYYQNPVVICGWEDYSWFQLGSETTSGFLTKELGKDVVRINKIFSGNPNAGLWATVPGTDALVDYFGPEGLGYIPENPSSLSWNGASSSDISDAIRNGAFMTLYDDHGNIDSWGCPPFSMSQAAGLYNDKPTFVFSLGCSTGKFDHQPKCFAEAFHRQPYGALGIIASTELAYKLVNEVYHWGLMDYLWPEFMPDYENERETQMAMPAFASTYGKYFLESSSWPYNFYEKEATYNVFHHHGDAYSVMYTEIPQELNIQHAQELIAGARSFQVSADEGALISLCINDEIIGRAAGTGDFTPIQIAAQEAGTEMRITVIKQNHFRYSVLVPVSAANGAYVICDSVMVNDDGNPNINGLLDYGETAKLSIRMVNIGNESSENLHLELSSTDEYISITDANEDINGLPGGVVLDASDAFAIDVANDSPDGHKADFQITADDGSAHWTSHFSLHIHSAKTEFATYELDDAAGNENHILEAGERAEIILKVSNPGTSEARSVIGTIDIESEWLSTEQNSVDFGNLEAGDTALAAFSVLADAACPTGHLARINLQLNAEAGIHSQNSFYVPMGRFNALVLDLDGNANSAPAIAEALEQNEISYDSRNSFPEDLRHYESMFICLGGYPDNHILTFKEGDQLKAYLNAGGNIYMEGGETWFYDVATSVHPLFGIDGTSDGADDMSKQKGIEGSFTEGMSFEYSGDCAWYDHIEAIEPAFLIFENESPAYNTAVAYDAQQYRTIGAAHEFGGLEEGDVPSSRKELMKRYLNFFGIPKALEAAFTSSAQEICQDQSIEFYSTSSDNAVAFEWMFEGGTPETSFEKNPAVLYKEPGTYDVSLKVSVGTQSHTIQKEDFITINVCASVDEMEANELIRIFPNPSSGIFYIDCRQIAGTDKIQVMNLQNEIISEINPKNEQIFKLDMSRQAAGIYLIKLSNPEGEFVRKIVVYQ